MDGHLRPALLDQLYQRVDLKTKPNKHKKSKHVSVIKYTTI